MDKVVMYKVQLNLKLPNHLGELDTAANGVQSREMCICSHALKCILEYKHADTQITNVSLA